MRTLLLCCLLCTTGCSCKVVRIQKVEPTQQKHEVDRNRPDTKPDCCGDRKVVNGCVEVSPGVWVREVCKCPNCDCENGPCKCDPETCYTGCLFNCPKK